MLVLKEHFFKFLQHAILTMLLVYKTNYFLENLGVAWSISRSVELRVNYTKLPLLML
jgi:hypothetical protein